MFNFLNSTLKPKLLAATIIAALPSVAMAATPGLLGLASTGSIIISVTKSLQAQITGLTDMTLSNWVIGQGAVTLHSDVCIYSSTGSYKVTATGNGLAGAFSIASGSNVLPYSVKWNSAGANNLDDTGTSLNTNSQSTVFTNASTGSANCNGGGAGKDTARVIVG